MRVMCKNTVYLRKIKETCKIYKKYYSIYKRKFLFWKVSKILSFLKLVLWLFEAG